MITALQSKGWEVHQTMRKTSLIQQETTQNSRIDKMIFQLSLCNQSKDTFEKTPEAFAQEARNFTLSHGRKRYMRLFLTIRPFLSTQMTHIIAKITQIHSILFSLSPPKLTFSICKKDNTECVIDIVQDSPTAQIISPTETSSLPFKNIRDPYSPCLKHMIHRFGERALGYGQWWSSNDHSWSWSSLIGDLKHIDLWSSFLSPPKDLSIYLWLAKIK